MSVPKYRACSTLARRLADGLAEALRKQEDGSRAFAHVHLANDTVRQAIRALRRAARKGVK
jgi:5,10-methylenetetrahydrofolate reductase